MIDVTRFSVSKEAGSAPIQLMKKPRCQLDTTLRLIHHFLSGHAFVSVHGPTWWRTDGDLQATAEQVQSYQHDFPSGK